MIMDVCLKKIRKGIQIIILYKALHEHVPYIILGTTADRHPVCRWTYNRSIYIRYVNRNAHRVCRFIYCVSIEIYLCMYIDGHIYLNDRHTWCVCRSIYCMSIYIYVDRDTVCRSIVVPKYIL